MLKEIIDWMMYGAIGLDSNLKLIESINFFIYDSIKLMILLFFMISVLGFFRTYIPQNQIKNWISGRRYGFSNLMASIFGAMTPFCSCSSIPIFFTFMKAGVPLGVNFSFLITSPIINEYLVVIMWSFFGWKITLAYVISGILIGVISGLILGEMGLEKYLVKDIAGSDKSIDKEIRHHSIKGRIQYGLGEARSIITKLWIWILFGVGVGAIMHNYVPSEFIQSVVAQAGYFAVPIAVMLGVPMYGSCAAILPIAVVLFQKGMPIGTALSFMMAISALSLPEAIILRRAMKLKLILIFFGIVTLAIIFTGYLFNALQPILI